MTFVTSNYRSNFQGERSDPYWVHRIFNTSESKDGWSSAEIFLGGQSDLSFSVKDIKRQINLRVSNLRALTKMLDVAPSNEAALDEFLAQNEFDVAYIFGLHKIGTSVIRSLMKKHIPVLYHQGDEWLAFYVKPGRLKRIMLNLASPIAYFRERRIDLRNVYLVSEFMKQRFLAAGFREEQLGVIYRGIEMPLKADLDRERYGPPVFLVASRLTLYKGIHFAIRAAAILFERYPDLEWELWIAGHGDPVDVQYFHKLVDELGVQSRVRFLGKLSRESTYSHMERASAVISPSVFDEPFGNTNIEAMASGSTLIASRSGAIEEIIEHGKSGLIYDRGNAEELAHQMYLILANPGLRESLAKSAIEVVRSRFLQDTIMDQVEAKLAEIANVPITQPVQEDSKVSLQ